MSHRRRTCGLVGAMVLAIAVATRGDDWPQWGGAACRNLVSAERGLPASFTRGELSGTGRPDASTAENVRWIAWLGSAAYGNPTVAGGRVFVGTDDLTVGEDPRLTRTRGGMIHCFDEATGQLRWRLVTPQRTQLPPEMHFGHQHLGVCSSPTVEDGRVYAVTTANEVVCLDADGLADGNDGPFTEEGQYMAGVDQPPVELNATDADIVWCFDLIDELGVYPHDAASCSVLIHGDLLYLSTSNGVDGPHTSVLAPEAPAIVALDKRTGRLAARENEGISSRLYHAQWCSPSLGQVDGRTLVCFGGGDGCCYAFEALDRVPEEPVSLKKVWSYDANPPHYRLRDGKEIPYYDGDKRKKGSANKNDGKYLGPSQIIATPVLHEGRLYVAIGQDPAHGRGRGLLHCIDPSGSGDITSSGCVWQYDGIERTISTVAVAGGRVYAPDIAGRLHCLDAVTGKLHWIHDTGVETWAGPLLADEKIFLGTKKGLTILSVGDEPRLLSEINLGSPMYSTAVAANGTLYVASQRYLWAVAAQGSVAGSQ